MAHNHSKFNTPVQEDNYVFRKDTPDEHTILVRESGVVGIYNTRTGECLTVFKSATIGDLDAFLNSFEGKRTRLE